jgi:nitrate/nitrite-specific signal transduction histidine kinase
MEQFISLHFESRVTRTSTESVRPGDRLTVAQASRARLDSSLEDVVVVARRVQNSQIRVRELLAANRSVACYRDRTALLAGIVHSAVALVDAQWGVLEAYEMASNAGRFVYCGTDARRSAEAWTTDRYLQRDNERFGILYLGREGPKNFSASDEQLLSSFIEMASIALWNMNQREQPGLVDTDQTGQRGSSSTLDRSFVRGKTWEL